MFFCLIIRGPPRPTRTSTLFPDPTLFRSGVAVERATAQQAADMRDVDSGVIAVVLARAALAGDVGVDRARPAVDEEARVEAVERCARVPVRSEEHTSELQSLMRNSYAVFCLKKKNKHTHTINKLTHE